MSIKRFLLVLPFGFLGALPASAQEASPAREPALPQVFTPNTLLAVEQSGILGHTSGVLPTDLREQESALLRADPGLPFAIESSTAPTRPSDSSGDLLDSGLVPDVLSGSVEPYLPPLLPCACGCGIFEVGNGSMLPQGQGGLLFFEWDYQDQNHNWSRHHRASADDNGDKMLWTSFYRFGLQYMFNERWGIQADAPFAHRYFRRDDGSGNGTNEATEWTDWGDMRVKALYTGFFKDMSLGVDFGLKLPTGNYTQQGADRDTELGTGSTDLLLGGFYRTPISADRNWNAFFQMEATLPLFTRDQYRPGLEVDASSGINYQGIALGTVSVVPFAQVLLAGKTSDRGPNSAQPVASGYQRVLLSPGLELLMHPFMVYADVEVPVWQNFRGDQLVASALYKLVVAFSF